MKRKARSIRIKALKKTILMWKDNKNSLMNPLSSQANMIETTEKIGYSDLVQMENQNTP